MSPVFAHKFHVYGVYTLFLCPLFLPAAQIPTQVAHS